MEKIEPEIQFVLQCHADRIRCWMYVSASMTHEAAAKRMEFEKNLSGHENRKYRIVRATTTYEVMEGNA